MERDGLIEDRAFAFLAPVSSHANVKPGDVVQGSWTRPTSPEHADSPPRV